MPDIKIYKTQDLILEVKKTFDPKKLNLKQWVDFLDVLCGDREYQKEAITNAIIYLASGEYKSIENLVEENFRKNSELQKRYKNVRDYQKNLPLPHKLSAVIDLATGTGKSYVIYGIAQIALGLGLVDKVLVLCPSLTIESGLKEKFENLSGAGFVKDTVIEYNTYSIDEVADKIMNEFSIRDWEAKILKLPGGDYKNQIPPREEIRNIIENSLTRRGIKSGRVREDNKQRILQAFGTLLRKKGKSAIFERKISKPVKINTKSLEKESIAVGNIKRGATVFYFDNFEQECNPKQTEILRDLIQENQKLSRGEQYSLVEVNHHIFKTPVNKVLTNKAPEEKFVDLLVSDKIYQKIDAWIKSRDVGFYSIEYSWRKGEHPTQSNFNPDFFLKIGNNIVVVEIKSDGDDSDENKAKYKWAKKHFTDLNKELKNERIKQKYFFHFLSPESYAEFAEYLTDGRLFKGEFESTLEELLEK